ncbi:hypothetical protein [Streptomyces liliifuscus]|uniref:Uncharacterized protein n=1 Tax=Streptomyces liliifuscus TaxID=2797636 RepID=A0A7T7L2E8_9ACTN|nr:hypothetical protein [Streptomyces liliifuscus]QQM45184.1 hypothetical protein JEQ17_41135 [Streptomyces liliifuscus]
MPNSELPQVRDLATQLIRNAIKEIDPEVACDHVVATLGAEVDVDALAFGSEAAVRKAQIDISWDGDSDADASRLARVERLVEDARDKGNASVDIFALLDALGLGDS